MRNILAISAIGAGLFVSAQDAIAADFYGITVAGRITRIDTTAQTVTELSSLRVGPVLVNSIEDLDFDSAGNLYAARNFTDFGTFQQVSESYRILNPMTGNALLSATLGTFGRPFTSLAATGNAGEFHTVNNTNGYMGRLNVTNGAFAPTTGLPHGVRNFVDAVAVNPVDGQAYGLIDNGLSIFGIIDYTLIRLNLDTGVSTIVGSLAAGSSSFKALRFDNAGTLFTVNADNGDICTINVATGQASFLFAGGAAAINTSGLAYIIPAPGAAMLLGLAGLVVTRRRR